MNGMEMMLSRLIGLKPEEMKAQIAQGMQFMEHGAKAMLQIQSDLALIKKHLGIIEETNSEEVQENVGRIEHNGRSSHSDRIQL